MGQEVPNRLADPMAYLKLGETLSLIQQAEIKTFLEEFKEIFTKSQGHTTFIEHQITRHLLFPSVGWGSLRHEVKKMLDLGVIEESGNVWCSLIVLVPKPDHSIEFCIELYKVNAVSKHNAYLCPNT